MHQDKILFVDDEPNILRGIKRSLRDRFNVATAEGGFEGITMIKRNGPFAVVFSDFRMPVMNGVHFLSEVKKLSPDTVRIMLTGFADITTSIDAVNQGHVFRFLTKPCPDEILSQAIEDALHQYRLIKAEKELLESTFSGSIKILIDILSLVNPIAFSRAVRIQNHVKDIVRQLELSDAWEYQIAALLSHLGCVALPQEILEKKFNNEELTWHERTLYANHPETGAKMLEKIPRMENIAGMIRMQNSSFDKQFTVPQKPEGQEKIELGAQILRTCIELDQRLMQKKHMQEAYDDLYENVSGISASMLDALRKSTTSQEKKAGISKLPLEKLLPGMILEEHIRGKQNGMLLATRGQQITHIMLKRLMAFKQTIGIKEPIRVRIEEE